MDFAKLPSIPMIEIMKMLPIGSRYNLSLVFTEMKEEVRKSIPPVLPFLSKHAPIVIDNLSDLESAGVLASYGYLESIGDLILKNLDVTNVPSNILSSLTRVASQKLRIQDVDGFELSMLGNLNCEDLSLSSMSISASAPVTTPEIHVRNCRLLNISGNLCGLLDSITCDYLSLTNVFDEAICDSISRMLPSRVRKLKLGTRYVDEQLLLNLLANYDGGGRCNEISFMSFCYTTKFKENLRLWATTKGWTVDFNYQRCVRFTIRHY